MRCIIFVLLAIIALSSSYRRYGPQKEIRVNGDARIVIRSEDGIVVFEVPRDDPTTLEIAVKDRHGSIKIIKINNDRQIIKQISLEISNQEYGTLYSDHEDRNTETKDKNVEPKERTKFGNPQMQVLLNIFRKYEGVPSETAFYKLLKEVKQAVDFKELHPVIYDVLTDLEVIPTSYESKTEKDSTESYLTSEGEKPDDPKDQKRSMETPNDNDKAKLAQAVQAANQVQWIQNLLKNQQNEEGRQRDVVKDADIYLKTSAEYPRQSEDDLKQMLFQTNNIQELQRDIIKEQLKAQQLLVQQQFLGGQKQLVKLHKQMGYQQGLHTSQLLKLRYSYDQLSQQEQRLIEDQIKIQKAVRDLQDRLIKQQEKLKDDIKRDDNREERY